MNGLGICFRTVVGLDVDMRPNEEIGTGVLV